MGRTVNVLYVVHVLHSIVCLRVLRETDEAKATATASVAVFDNDLGGSQFQAELSSKNPIFEISW